MHTRDLHVTIQLDHETTGIRAQATLRDDKHPVTGVGWLARHRTDPFPARDDLAVVRALRDLADRLLDRGRQAHPCAPGGDETARSAGFRVPLQRRATCPTAVSGRRAAAAGGFGGHSSGRVTCRSTL